MFKKIIKLSLVLVIHFYTITCMADNIGQLPHCIDNTGKGLVIVSTLDGKLSTLNSTGSLVWEIQTGPGPLLKSNIHNVELNSNGEWIRIIPSLTGGLYKFNGKTIDALPISADSLLKSSFLYSHDLVIAGGKEVRTYGIGLQSGVLLYTCSLLGCQNETNYEGEIDNVLIIERNTLTVRAHEPRTGNERWNFSVGHHNVKIPNINCMNTDLTIMNFNVSAVLPEGLLIATETENRNNVLWKYKFEAPIVNVWIWNGRDLTMIDTFDIPQQNTEGVQKIDISPAIYLAMHNKQLYIHESNNMLNLLQSTVHSSGDVIESHSITTIPWKPIPASTAVISNDGNDDKSTALSVLYNSEYVNGNGYYLYADKARTMICTDSTIDNTYKDDASSLIWSLERNWRYVFFTIATVISIYLIVGPKTIILLPNSSANSKRQEKSKYSNTNDSGKPASNMDDEEKFSSIYESSFDTVGCLGKGGFGVVFEAKQKIDECIYAIKRISLPNDNSKEHVLREVKALAKLNHENIVRYYNSWFERPPLGWQLQHDKRWLDDRFSVIDTSYCPTNCNSSNEPKHKRSNSTVIDMSSIISSDEIPSRRSNCLLDDDDISFRDTDGDTDGGISFRFSKDKSNSISFRNDSNHTNNKLSSNSDEDNKNSSLSRTNSSESSNRNISYPKNDYNKDIPVYLYIQMQLCKKESLKDWLFTHNIRSKMTIVPIFKQILNAVEYIHSKALIHRDLKPNNIFFSMENDIKVGDFGLVTTMNEDNEDQLTSMQLLHSHTKGAGTELYMSPEQLGKKRYNFKVDIYSLGVILFELLVPFTTEMERFKMLSNLRNHNYPSDFGNKFPDEHRLLEKMLSNNPDVRPTTAEIKKTPPFSPTC